MHSANTRGPVSYRELANEAGLHQNPAPAEWGFTTGDTIPRHMREPIFALRGLCVLMLALAAGVRPARAQEEEPSQRETSRPNVFFDCQGRNCNNTYFRTEIEWVNWVRAREDSNVHVIMTSQATGSGGREYQMDFMGRDQDQSYEDQIFYRALVTDTEREALDGIAHALGVGLARFANEAGYRGIVRLERVEAGAGGSLDRVVSAGEVDDPWNLWSFRVGASGNLDGETTRQTIRVNGNWSVSRVTPTWKQSYSGRANFSRQEFERSDSSIFVDQRTDWNFNALVVYAIADHWSVGFRSLSGRLTRFNQDFRFAFTPAIEFSFFPYEEATRRSLTASYEIGPTYRNYIEETVFGELEETLFEQSLEVELSQRQAWGDASVSVEWSHFLHDTSLRTISLDGNISFRITRGLSLNADADVSWVNDQVFLSAEGQTDEEILLRLAQRSTDFDYGISFGFSFQFGSIFNNVVNNRFGGGGGGRGRGRGFGRFFR